MGNRVAISWLCGKVFLFRGFKQEISDSVGKVGWKGFFEEQGQKFKDYTGMAPDWTSEEQLVFQKAFESQRLNETVTLWWAKYTEARSAGEVPSATRAAEPWDPG